MKPLFALRRFEDFLFGRGVVHEWKAFSLAEVEEALLEMSRFEGWKVGYLSYDLGMLWQGISSRHERSSAPLLHFAVPEEVVISPQFPLVGALSARASEPVADGSYDEYAEAIRLIHEALREGETYQVNFAQRFLGSFEGDAFEFFRRLHEMNPSSCEAYLGFSPVTIVSNSPERLCSGRRLPDGSFRLRTEPIKGTVSRGATPEEDRRLIEEDLVGSEKHDAELSMIVDMSRNDLGHVCRVGSVEVLSHREVRSYSHVSHTVSVVEGILEEGLGIADVLRALFPGASVTGAPKKRTMGIIDRLEPCARGVYTGSVGWISPEGEFDFNILIRTLVFDVVRGRYSYHVGGGIVADSTTESEYLETLHKAEALLKSLHP